MSASNMPPVTVDTTSLNYFLLIWLWQQKYISSLFRSPPDFPGVVLKPARLEDGSECLWVAEVGVVGDQEVDLPQQGLGRQEYQRGADREVRLGDADAVVLRDTRLTVEMQIFL